MIPVSDAVQPEPLDIERGTVTGTTSPQRALMAVVLARVTVVN